MKLRHTIISVPAEGVWLDGLLSHSPEVRGLAVVLLPGTGHPAQSRESRLAEVLQEAGFATLTVDLLTRYEENRDPDARFNVPQLANRVLAVAEWVAHQPPLAPLAVGLVASATASGAAVRAAWKAPDRFAAIVCRGGRPDLAGASPLGALATPIRMVVGSEDGGIPMISTAYQHIRAPRDWRVVTGAGEDFEEPGTLDEFARLAADWLATKLPPPSPPEAVPGGPADHGPEAGRHSS